MSAKEALSWRYFFLIFGPVGHERFDRNFAIIAKAVVDGYIDHEKVETSLEDFEPKYKFVKPKDEEELAEELQKNAVNDFKFLMRQFGG
jgi:hypothetical protein